MKSVFVVAIFGALIGCGDNHHNTLDAAPQPPDGPPIDAPPDAPPQPLKCDYTEMQDTTNDFNLSPGVEDTGLHIATGQTKTICGNVNSGHFNASNGDIDVDNYSLTVDNDMDVLVTLRPPSGMGPSALAAISSIQITAVAGQGGALVNPVGGYFLGNHAVSSFHLPAGTYQFAMEATGNGDIAASVPYDFSVAPDSPNTRCPELTTNPTYTEAHDGASSNENDVVENNMGAFSLLPAGRNTPEPTNIGLAAGSDVLIQGQSAAVNATGSYFDMDTYALSAGPTTTQATIRVDWLDSNVVLDFYGFIANTISPAQVQFSTPTATNSSRFVTIATLPGQEYWFTVGEPTLSGGQTGVLEPYNITICPTNFVPN